MEILMEPKVRLFLVPFLFFLISVLINLIQHHYYRRRADRFNSLGKLETACALEMEMATSLKDMGKALHIARAQLSSSIEDIEGSLRSFREFRVREKAREKHKRGLDTGRGKKP